MNTTKMRLINKNDDDGNDDDKHGRKTIMTKMTRMMRNKKK